jgi:SAM-dependent methyltransferase
VGSVAIVGLIAWWWAFQYLIDFRRPDVPFITTPPDIVAAMIDLADVQPTDLVYDLGCGDGRLAIAAAQRGARAVGYDIDPELVTRATAAVAQAGLSDRVRIERADIFKLDFRAPTVVLMFLTVPMNEQLLPQLRQLPPGARVVSHTWSMPGATPTRKIVVRSTEDTQEHTLYLWIAPF